MLSQAAVSLNRLINHQVCLGGGLEKLLDLQVVPRRGVPGEPWQPPGKSLKGIPRFYFFFTPRENFYCEMMTRKKKKGAGDREGGGGKG